MAFRFTVDKIDGIAGMTVIVSTNDETVKVEWEGGRATGELGRRYYDYGTEMQCRFVSKTETSGWFKLGVADKENLLDKASRSPFSTKGFEFGQ